MRQTHQIHNDLPYNITSSSLSLKKKKKTLRHRGHMTMHLAGACRQIVQHIYGKLDSLPGRISEKKKVNAKTNYNLTVSILVQHIHHSLKLPQVNFL